MIEMFCFCAVESRYTSQSLDFFLTVLRHELITIKNSWPLTGTFVPYCYYWVKISTNQENTVTNSLCTTVTVSMFVYRLLPTRAGRKCPGHGVCSAHVYKLAREKVSSFRMYVDVVIPFQTKSVLVLYVSDMISWLSLSPPPSSPLYLGTERMRNCVYMYIYSMVYNLVRLKTMTVSFVLTDVWSMMLAWRFCL